MQSTGASLQARFDCGGAATRYRFEYVAAADFGANVAAGREGFAGARVSTPEGNAGKCSTVLVNPGTASGLQPETNYFYRVVARNAEGTATGPEAAFMTRSGSGGPLALLDGRGWEMVSPVDKNGGAVEGPEGDGLLRAAAGGGAVAYGSKASFGEGAEGAPGVSQYLAQRSAAGWSTQNVSKSTPYLAFSPDLGRGVLANPALAFVGASPDLEHVAVSTCAALTADAVEVPAGSGCDEGMPNLYERSSAPLQLVNLLPGHSTGTPPGRLAAPIGAVSADGSRIYWTDGSDLYLREGGRTVSVDGTVGGGGAFQLATPDGGVAFFTKGGDLYRYDAAAEAVADLTPGGGVIGVLGASTDGSYVYFATAAGIYLDHGGIVAVAPAPDAVNFPPSTGTARVSPDGTHLLFISAAKVTLYESADPKNGQRFDQIYLYDANRQTVACVSCNPFGEPPLGSASVPGAVHGYKPRSLTDDGRRVFFDSPDRLAGSHDSNEEAQDVYEWEEGGVGSCALPQGCLQLISGGRNAGGSEFADASADGADAFFLTDASLVKADPGSVDLYDAREGGGLPEPEAPIPCEEDACQPLPPAPDDPSPGTLVQGPGNPPVHFPKKHKKAKRHHKKRRHHKRRAGGRR